MRDFRDAKTMAQTLRQALKAKSVSLTHSESLELVARTFGFPDWNFLAAKIQASEPAAGQPVPATVPAATSTGSIVPIIPMRDLVLFPQMVMPVFVGRERTRRAVERAMAEEVGFSWSRNGAGPTIIPHSMRSIRSVSSQG
jgi:ATP-dependent Lon protease